MASEAGPSSNTTTTTVHGPTITTTIHRGRPYTISSTAPPNQTPTSIVSAPDNPTTTTSAGPITTRNTFLAPAHHVVNARPISIRRLPSSNLRAGYEDDPIQPPSRSASGRGRSTSAPQHLSIPGTGNLTRQSTRESMLPTVAENPQRIGNSGVDRDTMNENMNSGVGRRRSVSNAAQSIISRFSDTSRERSGQGPDYDAEVVDLLDVLDPEVSTLTTLNNVQNSLFVPDLGRWVNRRPTYNLSSRRTTQTRRPEPLQPEAGAGMTPIPETTDAETLDAGPSRQDMAAPATRQRSWSFQRKPQLERLHSITSVMTESHYAVLPHGVSLEGWSEEDKEILDDHVRHMMHSKRSKFKQRMVAFGKYVQKPLGLFVFIYATLITLFGLAWVLFLIGWIYAGDRKDYLTNIIDNVLVALFAVMGDGLAPFRIVDTYHMIFIAHYHHKSWRLRRERALPKLHDRNDLPAQREKEADPEAAKPEDAEFSVLNHKQQQKLIHHQAKFSKSHSFYKPHETGTHFAFPLPLLVAIVCLLDCHSLFQIALGTCTWAIDYHTRPQALTATILCCSITCNITAGILISVGDRKTRKKDVALRMQRQALTQTAIEKSQYEAGTLPQANAIANAVDNGNKDGGPQGVKRNKAVAECVGMAVMMLVGTCASITHFLGPGGEASLFMAYFAWASGAMAAIYISVGGDLNPAVTIMMHCRRGVPWRQCMYNIIGQLIGSVLGTALAYALHHVAIGEHAQTNDHASTHAGVFWTSPQGDLNHATAFFNEFLATALLAMVVLALADARGLAPPGGLSPLIMAWVIVGLQIAFGRNTGPCLNPARDLGPRLVSAAAGLGRHPFTANGWWWIWGTWIGPILGALAGALCYDVFIRAR